VRASLPLFGILCRADSRPGIFRAISGAATLCAAVLLLFSASPAAAWSPGSQREIARDAARLAPPDLARLLQRHGEDLEAGAIEPFSERDASRHSLDPAENGRVDESLRSEVAAAIEAIRSHRPFAEISQRLGRVSHWVADVDNPLNAASSDSEESRYFRDYLLYAQSARPRMAVVVYEWKPPVAATGDLERMIAEARIRGSRLYPLIGSEYRRIGFASGRSRFDDRSTAFAVASIAYSHAVTDTARVFRYIWLAAGGADPRPVFARTRDRVLVLDQGGVP